MEFKDKNIILNNFGERIQSLYESTDEVYQYQIIEQLALTLDGLGTTEKVEKIEDVCGNLISIYFRKSYNGFGDVTAAEEAYLNENEFICVVTEKTKNNGYDSDSEWVKNNLEIGKEYTLLDMSVGPSSSTLRLKEFPNNHLNTVNFEIKIKKNEKK